MTIRPLVVASLVLAALAGCERNDAVRPAAGPPTAPPRDTLVLVNGKPITDFEVGLRLRGPGAKQPGEAPTPEDKQAALDALVLQELQAQRAVELGLDADPGYQETMRQLEAQLREARRKELAKLYRAQEVFEKSAVSDEVAKRWWDAHTARAQTELKVLQILVKGRPAAAAADAALAKGDAFEQVAAAQFGDLPEGMKPWELPVLTFDQVPPQWWGAVDTLEPGKVSASIAAPGDRFWIIKLLEKKQNAALTFEAAKPRIQAQLKSDSFEARRAQLETELRSRAKIELLTPPPALVPSQQE